MKSICFVLVTVFAGFKGLNLTQGKILFEAQFFFFFLTFRVGMHEMRLLWS